MHVSLRLSLRLGCTALAVLWATSFLHAQSMMLRNTPATPGGNAVNKGDFNNDGIPDLVIANSFNAFGNNSISVYLGRGDGTFAPPINTSTGQAATDIALGDFNRDGKLDVAIMGFGNALQIMLGKGDGTFKPPENIVMEAQAVSLAAADFNGDGKLDLAVAIAASPGPTSVVNEIEILAGDGARHFALTNTLQLGQGLSSFVTKVRVGDFNRDGKADIAVLELQAAVWFGNGNFTFDQVVLNHYTQPNEQTNDMTTTDVDQDGFTDILVSFVNGALTPKGQVNTGGADAFFGGPARSLRMKHLFASNNIFGSPGDFGSPRQMFAADINGDGINDIAALDDDPTAANGLYVWMGNPDGSYQQTPVRFIYTTDHDNQALVAGDLNRDGKTDFATVTSTNNTLEVFLNATPRAPCRKSTANRSMTVCQPQEATFSNSPLHIVAQGNSANHITGILVYVDNLLQGRFAAASIDKFFALSNGNHFVIVKGFDATGAHFRSDRHITTFAGAPGQTCATSSQALSVHVCSPAQNAALNSPVRVFANAYSPRPISAIQVYIDGHLDFQDLTASAVDKKFSMGPGLHFIEVKAFDVDGHQISNTLTVDVK